MTTATRRARPLFAVCLALLAGCGQRAEPEAQRFEIPVPDLSTQSLQAPVRRQLEEQARVLAETGSKGVEPGARARRYGGAGQVYHAYEYLDAAAACYAAAAALAPEEFRWAYYLGQVSRSQGDTEQAVSSLRRALALEPAYAPTVISLAQLLREGDRREEALEVLRPLLAEQPEHASANYVTGQILVELGRPEEGLLHLDRTLAAQPQATRVHALAAAASRKVGDEAGERRHLERRGQGRLQLSDPLMLEVTRLNLSARSYTDAGAAAFAQGRFAEAVSHYREAVALDPDSATAQLGLASAYVKTADAERAEHHYREALRIRPGFVEAHFYLALVLDYLGRTEEAVEHFAAVAGIQPGFQDVLPRLAASLARLGRCGEESIPLPPSPTRERVAVLLRERCP